MSERPSRERSVSGLRPCRNGLDELCGCLILAALTVDSDVILFGPLLCFALSLGLAWEIIMAVAITRQDVSVGDLRREAGRTRDAKAARRMLAIACVMEGQSREEAAETCGMDRQTLRDWVHRFNADGLAGLADLPRQNGPKPRLSPEQEAVVAGWVEQGPDLARDGVVRWRCIDLQERIKREWDIGLHERTIGKLLRRLAFRRLSVRPQHPKSDPEAQALFRTGSRAL